MPKTRSDYIREELAKNFDASANEVAERISKKGFRCSAQHVYQMRSNLRIVQARDQVRYKELWSH